MASLLVKVLNEFKIPASKIHLVARDDDSAMKKAIRTAGFDSIHCTAHKLNLVSLVFLFH